MGDDPEPDRERTRLKAIPVLILAIVSLALMVVGVLALAAPDLPSIAFGLMLLIVSVPLAVAFLVVFVRKNRGWKPPDWWQAIINPSETD